MDNPERVMLDARPENCDELSGTKKVTVSRWAPSGLSTAEDLVAEEAPIAMVYNGVSHVVMMATPKDLEDFALGFSLSEGVIAAPGELLDLDIVSHEQGIEINMTILARQFARLKEQRRNLAGRSGCGLCGYESLSQIKQPEARLFSGQRVPNTVIARALQQLEVLQPLRKATGACHGAAWCSPEGDILVAREDVGRHNALDKLLGFMAKTDTGPANGFALISSRASFEMVQKAAAFGISTLVAVSAPTTLALDAANTAGVQLVGFCRLNGHVIYTN